jgi:drug/metabolite transporter (DMT)-like permease
MAELLHCSEEIHSPERMEQSREKVAVIQLVASTLLFGISFVGQKFAMTQYGIGPLTYTATRFLVSTLFLMLFRPLFQYFFHSQIGSDSQSDSFEMERVTRELFKWATLCGCATFGGSNLQQIGLQTVSVGITAFITGGYVIFVPLVEWFLPGFGLKLDWKVWTSAFISIIGMFFLSGGTDFSSNGIVFSTGEIIVFIGMLCWVVAIISADVGITRGVDGVSFTTTECAVTTVLSLCLALIFESSSFVYPFYLILSSWKMILFVGVAEAMSFLLATLGQMYVAPSKAALILSLESVTAAAFAYFLLEEYLSYKQLFGCFLMLAAAVFSSIKTGGGSSIMSGPSDTDIIELEQSNKNIFFVDDKIPSLPFVYSPINLHDNEESEAL